MKLKYFVRGLGMGILITALILGISYKSKYSDDKIISKAKKLGMVFPENDEETEEVSDEPTATPEQEQAEETTAEPSIEPSIEPTTEPTVEPTVNPTEEPKADNTTEPVTESPEVMTTTEPEVKPDDNVSSKETELSFVIERGSWSRKVAEDLESLGLVEDSDDFDKYLINNGYAQRIKVGTFKIKKGSDYQTIAKTITQR